MLNNFALLYMRKTFIFYVTFLLLSLSCHLSLGQGEESEYYYNYADSLISIGEYQDAIDVYNKCVDAEYEKPKPNADIISECLSNIGVCYYYTSDYISAIEWYEKAMKYDQENGNIEQLANNLNNIGYVYKILGQYKKAIEYYEKTIQIDEALGRGKNLAKTLNNIGQVYRAGGEYDKAIEYLERSLRIKQNLGDSSGMATTLNNIGLVYNAWKKYDIAIMSFEEALNLDQLLNNERGMANRLNNLGLTNYYLEEYDEALAFFHQALDVHTKLKDIGQSGIQYNNIGASYLNKGDIEQAVVFLQKARQIFQDLGKQSELAAVLSKFGDIYLSTGDYKKSEKYLMMSTEISKKINSRNQTKTNYQRFSDLYAKMGNYAQSLEYYKKYTDLKDTIFTEKAHQQITDFEIKYETEKKDIEIKLLKTNEEIRNLKFKKEKIYRLSLIGGVILLILLASVIFYSLRQKIKDNRIISEEKGKSDKLLMNILPAGVANELKEQGKTEPRLFNNVTVCFTDIVDFTEISAKMEPRLLIAELNEIFTAFDNIVESHHCERIKTIGDSFMAVCGLPDEDPLHAENIIRSAVDMIQFLEKKNLESKIDWKIRVGIHTGDVIAGVVGIKKYIYDLFGDTINTASRMECNAETMRINVSETTYNLVKDKFRFEEREEIDVKGKGKMKMFFIH